MSFSDFFNAVKNAEFTFIGIRDWILSIYYSITADSDIVNIWQFLSGAFNTYIVIFSIVVISIALAIAFFGQKMTGIIKFCLFFILGFCIGARYLAPIIPDTVMIKSWIIGLVVAVVTAVLYKYLYYALLSVAVGYSVYRIFFTSYFLPFITPLTEGRIDVCIAIAVVFIIITLIFNKWVERKSEAKRS